MTDRPVCPRCFAFYDFPDQPYCARCIFELVRIEANTLHIRPPSYTTELEALNGRDDT